MRLLHYLLRSWYHTLCFHRARIIGTYCIERSKRHNEHIDETLRGPQNANSIIYSVETERRHSQSNNMLSTVLHNG
jgi:hypothetical protein